MLNHLMNKLLSFLFTASCFLPLSYSYARGIIQWQNTIGGSQLDELRSISQTSDGGYIYVADTLYPIAQAINWKMELAIMIIGY